MHRAGSVRDIIAIASALLFVVVFWVSATMVISEFRDANQEMGEPIDDKYLEPAESALNIMDKAIVFVYGASVLAAVLFAFRIPTSPIFFVPSVILLSVATWISAEFSNVFWKFIHAGGPVTDAANQYSVMVTLMEQLPKLNFGFGLLIIVAMFVRRRGGRQQVVGV